MRRTALREIGRYSRWMSHVCKDGKKRGGAWGKPRGSLDEKCLGGGVPGGETSASGNVSGVAEGGESVRRSPHEP